MTRDEGLFAVRDFARSLRVGDQIQVPRDHLGFIDDGTVICTVIKLYPYTVHLSYQVGGFHGRYQPGYGQLYMATHDPTTGKVKIP